MMSNYVIVRRASSASLALILAAGAVAAAPLGGSAGGALLAQSATRRPAPGQLDAYVAKAVRDWGTTGLAIAVVKNDTVVFAKGYGVRELGKPGAVDTATRFAIGSTTKAMTALALGMLVDEGKVRWDDPVIKHLPDFRLSDPYVTREVTVRDLLTHRAGLGNADLLWTAGGYDGDEIRRRIAHLPLSYSFRSGYIYQNIMYAVAGDVVEAASGMPWEKFLHTRIFAPLGMTGTEALLSGVEGKPNVASPHAQVDGKAQVTTNRSVDPVKAAGSAWSSVADMAKWMRFLLDSGRVGGKRLVSEGTFREIFTPQTVAPPSMYPTTRIVRPRFFTYGLGWFLHDYRGHAVAMHTGSINGMSAIIGLIPDQRLGVYVLANTDHAELRHALMFQMFDEFTGGATRDWSAELLKLYGGMEEQGRAAQQERERRRATDTRPSVPIERYAGKYTDPTFGDVVVTTRNGALHLEYGERAGDLTHWQYESFQAKWGGGGQSQSLVVFTPDGTGGVAALRAFGVTFTRVRQAPPGQ